MCFENGEDYEQGGKDLSVSRNRDRWLVVAPARTTNDLDHFVKLQHEGFRWCFSIV